MSRQIHYFLTVFKFILLKEGCWAIPGNSQLLLLALCSEITSYGAHETICGFRD